MAHPRGAVIELAHSEPSATAFQRRLLEHLQRRVGFDVAFALGPPMGGAPVTDGLDPRVLARALREGGRGFIAELAPVKRAALAGRGAAVDTGVLGAARVHRCSYYRILAAPSGGGPSLCAYLRLRKKVIGTLVLGRGRRSSFREREIHRIEVLLPAVALALASYSFRPRAAGASEMEGLAPREREIAEYLCLGYTNPEIARALGTSPNTVRNQLARIFEKVGASTRAELAAMLARQVPRIPLER